MAQFPSFNNARAASGPGSENICVFEAARGVVDESGNSGELLRIEKPCWHERGNLK